MGFSQAYHVKTIADLNQLMLNLFKNILLLPGRLTIALLRVIGLAPPAPRFYIRRPQPSPLAISVSAFFWGCVVLLILTIGLKRDLAEPLPALSPPSNTQANTQAAQLGPLISAAENEETPPADAAATPAEPQTSEVWLVILHSIPKQPNSEADRRNARAEADRRANSYKRKGLDAQVFDTDSFPRLKNGFWAVALGPFETGQAAGQVGELLKEQAPGLMVRRVI